jgi:hypothetical protein
MENQNRKQATMIDPAIALRVLTRTQIALLSARLGKVVETEFLLSGEHQKELSMAVALLRQAVIESSKGVNGSMIVGRGWPPANKQEMLSELEAIGRGLQELVADNSAPEAAREGLSTSLSTIQKVLSQIDQL